MSSKRRLVETVKLRCDRPTELSFGDLYTWVIWQFPRLKRAGLCGAVRPPIADHTWYPALISRTHGRVLVYGHLAEEFASPAEAAGWLAKNPE